MDVLGPVGGGAAALLHMEGWSDTQISATSRERSVPTRDGGLDDGAAYLLWRDGRAPVGLILTIAPLTALLSPLALMGAMPLRLMQVASGWPTGAGIGPCRLAGARCAIALPGLIYMATANDTVGAGAVSHLHATDYAGRWR
jgi:hypothetical protein